MPDFITMNVSSLNTQKINNDSNLCEDPDTTGFDLQAGQSWIYPTNYQMRDYQFNIVQEALHQNTLVSLPTGLGKTFIAAVVMYNFFRWYPHGKVIFMAPTRPLVKQQMDACYDITAIPQEATAELTGSKIQQSRGEIWENKRVFFITPQVLQNDLPLIIELGAKIKCLVFDEAHRAKGNHAYCEVIRRLLPKNRLFRVLALSATPGNSARDVLEVMQNLLIAHLEFRSEESADVKPYVFERALETVVVPLGEKLMQVKEQYLQILEKYTRTLIKYKVIQGNCANLTKGKIFMVMNEFQARNGGNRTANYSEIMKSLNICISLYHAYETLIRCGLRAFLNFYKAHSNNPLLKGITSLNQILDDLSNYLGPDPEVQSLPDGTYAEIPKSVKFGHPKFYQLREILIQHFTNSEASTRVIVFFEYRESTQEAYALLTQSFPLLKPRVFVGQGSGVTQRDQINIVKAFRDGTCNTLLSTCIGEEGLDVGDVDLIVCFDIANKSPIRMIQRMGRTGRKKEGRVVVLVTEGREQQTLKDCLIYKNNLGHFASNTGQLAQGKYKDNPKMIPSYVQPKCQKMYITVRKPPTTKQTTLKNILKSIRSESPKFDDVEVVEIEERIKTKVESLWDKEKPLHFEFEPSKIDFSKNLENQRVFQAAKRSQQTEIFVTLLQFADSKRYNLPVTQKTSLSDYNQNKFLKQGDIRSMFARPSDTSTQEPPFSQLVTFEKEKDITQSFPPELFEEITNYLTIQTSQKESCQTCEFLFECPQLVPKSDQSKVDLSSWVVPDLSIVANITVQDLAVFAESLSPKCSEKYRQMLDLDDDIFDEIQLSTLENEESIIEKKANYETPRNFDKILDSFRIQEADPDEEFEKKVEKSFFETPKTFGKVLNFLGNVEKDEVSCSTPKIVKNWPFSKNFDAVLAFFKLSSLEEFFVSPPDLDETVIYALENPPQKIGSEESPDLFPSSEEKADSSLLTEEPDSPILCTYERVLQIKAKKKLFEESKIEENVKKPNLAILKTPRKSFFESSRKPSPYNRSPKVDIGDICDLSDFGLTQRTLLHARKTEENTKKDQFDGFGVNSSDCGPSLQEKIREKKNKSEEMNLKKAESGFDFDLSSFGLDETILEEKKNEEKVKKPRSGNLAFLEEKKNEAKNDDLDISDICDLSIFGLPGPSGEKNKKNINFENKNIPSLLETEDKLDAKQLTIDDLCDMSQFFNEPFSERHTQKKEDKFSSDLDNFFDPPTRIKNAKKIESNSEKPQSQSSKIERNKNIFDNTLVDLTDSDFELSPKLGEKGTPSQLSVTQMLSLVAKTSSQKENTTPKLKKSQKFAQNKNLDTPKSSQKKISTPKSQKMKFNISLALDSDDEFEESSPVFAKPKPVSKKMTQPSSKPPVVKKRKKLFCEFIEEEAVLSEDENVAVSEDEDSGEDCFEASFVADETQDFLNTTHMQAKYLQSVRSPMGRGRFKIPAKPKFNISNVFSQEVSNEDNTYLNDSFCVNTEDIEVTEEHDLSELELLELKLKEQKKKKRKKSEEATNPKRRRIIMVEEDSE